DPVALETAGLEHPAGGQLVLRVLEDAPEGALVRRLGRLPLRLQLGDVRFDLVDGARRETQLDPRDDLAVAEIRMPVREAELRGRQPAGPVRSEHVRTLEDAGKVAAVRARVHPHAAAGRPGDRARALEPAESRGPRPV